MDQLPSEVAAQLPIGQAIRIRGRHVWAPPHIRPPAHIQGHYDLGGQFGYVRGYHGREGVIIELPAVGIPVPGGGVAAAVVVAPATALERAR
jgi:hypothetical protein